MGAVETYRDALFGNPPSPTHEPSREGSLAAFTELHYEAVIALYATQAGITIVATIALRDTFYSDPDNQGKLVYVNNNNGSATDPLNGVYEYVSGAARLAEGFYAGLPSALPGGADGQVQYKSGTTFAGASGLAFVGGAVVAALLASGTLVASAPALTITQAWDNDAIVFTGAAITLTSTDPLGNPSSRVIEATLNGDTVFRVRADANLQLGDSAVAYGGIRKINQPGNVSMGLWSQHDAITGDPADVVRFYWEDSTLDGETTSEVAVLKGFGSNRLSIESAASFVHISDNSRFEWEGLVAARLLMIGYVKGSSEGKTIDFNNSGQPGIRANPVVSFSAVNDADDVVHFGRTVGGSSWTTWAKVSALGLGTFQALDLPEQAAAGTPGTNIARLYSKDVAGVTKLAFTDSVGTETVLGALGGSSGSVQYNNGGVLGGVTGMTLSAGTLVALTIAGAANAIAATVTQSLSGSNAQAAMSISPTWNTSGTPTAFILDVTDTASNAASALMDLRIGGSSRLKVLKSGALESANSVRGTALIAADAAGANGWGLFRGASLKITMFDPTGTTRLSMMCWGGLTSANGALKASSTGLQARLGDDSDFTFFQAKLRTHANASAGAPGAATHKLIVQDAAGLEYYVAAIAV